MMEEVALGFESIYTRVRPIVLRLRQEYYIKMWELDDWEQEGMLCLYDLLGQVPELVMDGHRLRVFFKTKFSNRVKDEIRKQESIKRSFDRMAYDEIGEVAHSVGDGCMDVAEKVAFREAMAELVKDLSSEEQERLDCFVTGEGFRGKKALARKARAKLVKLGWGPDYSWM